MAEGLRHLGLDVLRAIRTAHEADDNVLALLVFGSVASGTFHASSDIDLAVVYRNRAPGFQYLSEAVDGLNVGWSRWSIAKLEDNARQFPYRMYVFSNATLLFDHDDRVGSIKRDLVSYFGQHPSIVSEWKAHEVSYRREKEEFGQGRTPISDIYRALDTRFARHTDTRRTDP